LLTHIKALGTRVPIAAVVCATFGVAAGYLAVVHPKLALVLVGGGVVIALIARSPVSIALLVAPAAFNVSRLTLGHGIAFPDVVLAIATVLSFPALSKFGTPKGVSFIRRWFAVYMMAMAVIVLLHPSGRSLIEAVHRTLLVGGALNVGAWIYLAGKTRLALRILAVVATVAGVICILDGAHHRFHIAAQPLGLQKDYVGSILGLSLLVILAAPDELEISTRWRVVCVIAIGGGLAASQSRGAMLGLVVGVAVWFLRSHSSNRRRSFLAAVVIGIGFLAFSGYLVKSQLADRTATQNTNSVAVRTKTEAATLNLWRTAPVIGVGINYFDDPKYQEMNHFLVAPTNVVVQALAEGGIVLAAGFIIFELGALSVLVRHRNALAVAALAMVADRLAHGMLDIFWTAGNSSLPWLIAGMGMAQASVDGRNGASELEPVEASPPIPAPSS
jgi:O-Antigen ligase